MVRGRHQWDHMGIDTETHDEYSHCALCNQYRCGIIIVPKSHYIERIKAGKITIDDKILPPDWMTMDKKPTMEKKPVDSMHAGNPWRTAHVVIEFDVITQILKKQYPDLDKGMNISSRIRPRLNDIPMRKINIKITVKEVTQ